MVYKTMILKALGVSNTAEAVWAKIMVPTGFKWTILEIRVYFSRTSNLLTLILYKSLEPFFIINSQVAMTYKLPYPANLEVNPGEEIRLSGVTDGNASDVIVELLYDEVRA